MGDANANPPLPISVALVGGGITGITLAVALLKRGIDVKIFEQAPRFTEIGAGIAFSPNAKQAMKLCDLQVYQAYLKVATRSASPEKANTWYDFYDGYNQETDSSKSRPEKLCFSITRDSADGCHRAHFLEELLKLIPPGVAYFNKHLDSITSANEGFNNQGSLTLNFRDGTSSTADVGKQLFYFYNMCS
jgi:salicylate hydroxylase